MSLNIKNEHVHALAREAASRTGKTQTSVIEEALARFLTELDEQRALPARRDDVDRILADFDRGLDDDARALLTTEGIYDERGLPA